MAGWTATTTALTGQGIVGLLGFEEEEKKTKNEIENEISLSLGSSLFFLASVALGALYEEL